MILLPGRGGDYKEGRRVLQYLMRYITNSIVAQNNFSLTKMHEVMKTVFDKYVKVQQKVSLVLPEIKKL